MTKVEKVKFIRMLSVVGSVLACFITEAAPKTGFGEAILLLPFTCLSGICAFMYYKLDKKEKDEVYKLSILHLYTIVMYPYFLFAGMVFLNILSVITNI